MGEPAEFSEANDPPEENEQRSPYLRIKSKVSKKINKKFDSLTREIGEELDEHGEQLDSASGVVNDLVEPETLQRLREIIIEQPEIEAGCDYWLWFNIIRKTYSWILVKFVDIFTDFAAAYQHFKYENYKYGVLTLFFVYLPGLVLALGFSYWGLLHKREGDGERRKEITCQRLAKYLSCVLIFPLLYPIIQILLGILLVGLLIRRRDHAPLKFMGHDLKQFKSMEGFLESGPQFTLQTYILLIGQRKDKYGLGDDLDWKNLSPDDAQRLLVLSFSIFMSYCSIVKTAYGVNVPDPDPRRKQPQDKKSSKWRFKITNCLFTASCVLFRLLSLAYFFVYLRQYTVIIIATAWISNAIVMKSIGASVTVLFFLGSISIFVPNGYLLYNFAGTFPVDFTRRGSMALFFGSTHIVNLIWLLGVSSVQILGDPSVAMLPKEHIIGDVDQNEFVMGMTIGLFFTGILSSVMALIHWYVSIEKLFETPARADSIPYIDEEGQDLNGARA